jgi:predicted NAD-dependent protein-ADP-ribosyltransferase YbiA (DUF1768 family)
MPLLLINVLLLIYPVFFHDPITAASILQETDPRLQKQIARRVRDFDETEWNKVNRSVVRQGSMEKVC